MNVLVTGGAGYLGSTLVPRLLNEGHRVRVLDNLMYGGNSLLGVWSDPGFEFRRGDIRSPEEMQGALEGIDAVVHLAAIVGDPACARQKEAAQDVNLGASLRLLGLLDDAGVSRFVFASTCSNYGRMSDPTRYVDEDAELAPVSLYAETKVAVEREILKQAQSTKAAGMILRFATLFGASPRMRFDLTVNEFTARLILEKTLQVYGEQFWRPYVHVADAARAIAMVLSAPPETIRGQVFNVGSTEQNFRKKDLVAMIQPHAPESQIEYVHKDEDPRDYRVSFSRIEGALGYRSTLSVEQGIQEVGKLVESGVVEDIDGPGYRN